MKRYFLIGLTIVTLYFSLMPKMVQASARTEAVLLQDVTERLENIAELKGSLRSLKLQIKTLEIALAEAKKHHSRKKIYNYTKKTSDAITALTILSGAIASYHFENKINILKIASFVGGLSSSVSVISGLLADMSTDEAEMITTKINDMKPILAATEVNLRSEIKYLCAQEPSNQMCR